MPVGVNLPSIACPECKVRRKWNQIVWREMDGVTDVDSDAMKTGVATIVRSGGRPCLALLLVLTALLFVNLMSFTLRDVTRQPLSTCASLADTGEVESAAQLLTQLLARLNSSSPLVVINITNVIHADTSGVIRRDNHPLSNKRQDTDKLKGKLKRTTAPVNIDRGAKRATALGVVAVGNNSMVQHFLPVMTDREKEILLDTLQQLAQVSESAGLVYMMYSGTLIGSYRHHDMVPWDDDFDVFMAYARRPDIVDALTALEPRYETWVAGSRVKLFSRESRATSKYPWRWPYVDISFYKENATHIWDGSMEDDYGDRVYVYPKSSVFPLHKRPLADSFFDAPHDTYDCIRRTYSNAALSGCMTSHYSHKRENVTAGSYRLPCWVLSKYFPFVHRHAVAGGGVEEMLKFGDEVLQTFIVDEPSYAITKPFELVLETQEEGKKAYK